MKIVLFAFLAAALLLLGCTYPSAPAQQPEAGAQNPQGQTTPPQQNELTGTGTQPQPKEEQPVVELPQKKQYTCSLELSPSTIYAGGSTDISFAVSTKDDVAFTYNCGAEVREISTGGLTSGSRLCDFMTPGEVVVWIKADGEICAQKTLTVLPESQAPRNCSVNVTKKDLQSYYYEAQVNFDGFGNGTNLTWKCDYTTATKKLTGTGPFGMMKYEVIYCDFNGSPKTDSIPVFVGDVKCGEIPTR